jgi:hypothetical protein
MLEVGEGQGTSLEQEVRGPATAPAHDLKQAQSVVVQHPKVGRAVVEVVDGLVALALSPRRWRVVGRPKVGRAGVEVVEVVDGLVALRISPRRRRVVGRPKVGRAGVEVVEVVDGLVALRISPRRRRVVGRPKVGRAVVEVFKVVDGLVALRLSPRRRRVVGRPKVGPAPSSKCLKSSTGSLSGGPRHASGESFDVPRWVAQALTTSSGSSLCCYRCAGGETSSNPGCAHRDAAAFAVPGAPSRPTREGLFAIQG